MILDLEDSVAATEKDAARMLVRNALRSVNFYGAERMVRINQGKMGLEDLQWIIPHNVHLVLIPKVETPEQVIAVDRRIAALEQEHDLEGPVYLMPIIESALGACDGAEALIIATDWPEFAALDFEDVKKRMTTPLIFDGRNLLDPATMQKHGFEYHGIGRGKIEAN